MSPTNATEMLRNLFYIFVRKNSFYVNIYPYVTYLLFFLLFYYSLSQFHAQHFFHYTIIVIIARFFVTAIDRPVLEPVIFVSVRTSTTIRIEITTIKVIDQYNTKLIASERVK